MGLTPLYTRILANTSTSPASSPTLEQQLYFLTTLCQPSLPLWSQPSLRSWALCLGQLGLGHFPPFPYIPRGRGAGLDPSSCKAFISLVLPPSFWALGFLAMSPYCIVLSSCVYGSLPLSQKSPLSLNISLHPFRGSGQRVSDPLSTLILEGPLPPNSLAVLVCPRPSLLALVREVSNCPVLPPLFPQTARPLWMGI